MENNAVWLVLMTAVSCNIVWCVNVTSRLEAVITEQANKLSQLEAVIMQQSYKMAARDAQLEKLTTTTEQLQARLLSLMNHSVPQQPVVAFDAQYRADPVNGLLDHDVMRFDNVTINLGNGYSSRNGTFQAPVAGVYVFHSKITANPRGQVYAYLQHNGRNIDSVNAEDDAHQETSSSTKVIHLQKGDRVRMKKSTGVCSVRGWVHTKLSAFLLAPGH